MVITDTPTAADGFCISSVYCSQLTYQDMQQVVPPQDLNLLDSDKEKTILSKLKSWAPNIFNLLCVISYKNKMISAKHCLILEEA